MKKFTAIIITIIIIGTLFTLAGKKVEAEIANATAKATATTSMLNR